MSIGIDFILRANTAAFTQALAAVDRATTGLQNSLAHKFEGRDLARGLATALGLSVDSIAQKLVTPFKESAEYAKSMADDSERSTRAVEQLITLHQTDAQQLATLQKEARHLTEELGKPAKEISNWRLALGAVLLHMGLTKQAADVIANTEAAAAKNAKTKADIQENALQIANKQKAIDDATLKNEEERWQFAQAHRRENELIAKQKTGTLLPAEAEELKIIKLQNKEKEIQIGLTYLLAKPIKEWTQADKERFTALQRQSKEIEHQIDLLTNPKIPDKPPMVVAIEGYIEKWEGFISLVTGKGRGNTELSDRELARKIATTRGDIASRQAALLMQSGVAGSSPYDSFLNPQINNLRQALSEQNFRSKVRRTASAFGEDRAFSIFSGLTEQRFAEIMKTATDSMKQTQTLIDIRDALTRRGIVTVPLSKAPTGP